MINSPSTPYLTSALLLMLLCSTFASFQVPCTQEGTRYITSLAWNGKYWLIGTFNEGCLVKLEGSEFILVDCIDPNWIHEDSIEWTGKYFLAIAGVYYCDAFAYDGKKLIKLPKSSSFREVKRVTGFGENCLVVDWEYPYNYLSILVWNGTSSRILVEDAFQLLPASRFTNFSANPFSPIARGR